mgnify:CR=1 FL=1
MTAQTREVAGVVRRANGTPWANAVIELRVASPAVTGTDVFPIDTLTVNADPDGAYSVVLVVGLRYLVRYPSDSPGISSAQPIYVPDGDGPLSLADMIAAGMPQPIGNEALLGIIEQRGMPAGGTAGQVLVKAEDGSSNQWVDVVQPGETVLSSATVAIPTSSFVILQPDPQRTGVLLHNTGLTNVLIAFGRPPTGGDPLITPGELEEFATDGNVYVSALAIEGPGSLYVRSTVL